VRSLLPLCLLALVAQAQSLEPEVLRAGEPGTRPVPGEIVRVRYRALRADGTVVATAKEPERFVVGRSRVAPVLDRAVRLVETGASCRFRVPAKLAPDWGDCVLELELVEIPRPPRFRKGDPAKQKRTDSGLVYEVLEEGAGERPRADQGVALEYALWTAGGALRGCSEITGQPLREAIAALPTRFMPEAVALLRPGARLRFEVPPELGSSSYPGRPSMNETTVWELELVEVFDLPPFPKANPDRARKGEGFTYEVVREGSGAAARAGWFATMHYTAWRPDGMVFQSTHARGEPARLRLHGERVGPVPGLLPGLLRMREGAAYRFELESGEHGGTVVVLVELLKAK